MPFFRYQTKPSMSKFRELYYEGKEFESSKQSWQPGILSHKIKEALGMGNTGRIPPPWLINMQRYGPPPSYPGLKIPGLNAAIPSGCQFGYGPGEWGKPPVDQEGHALYGDVFGVKEESDAQFAVENDFDKTFEWGKIEHNDNDEAIYTEHEDGAEKETLDVDGTHSTITGISSHIPFGMETPDILNLRKDEATTETPSAQATVVSQQKLFTTSPINSQSSNFIQRHPDYEYTKDVEVSFAPYELEGVNNRALRQLYENRAALESSRQAREDFSKIVNYKLYKI